MGYINSSGQVVIDFRFYAAQPFSEGLASVRINQDGKDGYIDKVGQRLSCVPVSCTYQISERD